MDRKEQSREVMRRLYGLAKSPMSALFMFQQMDLTKRC